MSSSSKQSAVENVDLEIWKYGKGLLLFIESDKIVDKLKGHFTSKDDKPLLKYNGAFAGYFFPGKLYEDLKEYCKKKKYNYKKCGTYTRPEKGPLLSFLEDKIIVRFSEKYREKSQKLKKISGAEWDSHISAWIIPKTNENRVRELFERYGGSKKKMFENVFYFVVKTEGEKNSVLFMSENLSKTREFVRKSTDSGDLQIVSRVDVSLKENVMCLSTLDGFAKVSLSSESSSSEVKSSSESN